LAKPFKFTAPADGLRGVGEGGGDLTFRLLRVGMVGRSVPHASEASNTRSDTEGRVRPQIRK